MPARTIDFSKIMEISENLYEAALIIGRRSRQINEEHYQKKRDRQILEELEGGFEEEFLHGEQIPPEEEQQIETDDNPVVQAQDEFLEGKIDFHYEPVRK